VGRFGDAAHEAGEALKLKPSLTNAHFFLGLSLAESDRCKEALPYLEKDYPRVPDPQLKRAMGTDALRCAMNAGDPDKAIDFVRSLNHDFPDDPDLLFLSSHLFSDLSTQASQRLLMTAPGSYQAHQLNAEVLEIQGKLSEAGEEYRKVLALNPSLGGIHYEMGQLLLAGDRGPNTLDEARREFEEELKNDPRNPAPEYELGEMARQARQWNEAIGHFERATKLDPQFAEALIGLGKSLVSAGRVQEAVAPLERAVKLEPANPNTHYQLSFAYRRLGRDQEAAKELSAYRETHDKYAQTMQRVRVGILGNIAQPQTDSPPE
jgi:tetratricopeptide (TPR) repeat protein